MKTQYWKKIGLSLLILSSLFTASGYTHTVKAQSIQPDQATVLFVIDDSGSMAGNDPANLRYTAAKLFVAALDEGDAVGAVRFATVSQPLIESFKTISSYQDKNEIINAFQPVKADGYTDVKAAFSNAESVLKTLKASDSKTLIIFLTDGKPEIPALYPEYETETMQIVERLGVPVYSIALTYGGQSAFLTKVSSQTGGKIFTAKSAGDLLDSYLQILGDVKDRTVIGEGVSRSPGEAVINLDDALIPYVSKVTFLVSQSQSVSPVLIAPDGNAIKSTDKNVAFAMDSDPAFSAYTITAPASGDWKFQLDGSGTAQVRAIIHSRLRAKILSPNSMIEAGEPMPIVVNMFEEQVDGTSMKVVGEASFSATITLPDGSQQSLDTFYDDGTHGDRLAGDGDYSRRYVDTAATGTYQIKVQGIKGVVPLSVTTRVEAVPFPQIVIDSPSARKIEVHANPIPLEFHLEGLSAPDSFEGTLKAVVSTPSGRNEKVPVKMENGKFTGEFLPVESGAHSLMISPENAHYLGIPYQKEARAVFDAVVFKQANIQSAFLSLDGKSKRERFEVQQATNGIPLLVTVQSNINQPEQLSARLENLPAFSLEGNDPVTLRHAGETTFSLSLKANSKIEPGVYEGNLNILSNGSVDLLNNRIPIRFELFNPAIEYSAQIELQTPDNACWKQPSARLILHTSSNSMRTEELGIDLKGIKGVQLAQTALHAAPGDQQYEMDLVIDDGIHAGKHDGTLTISSARQGVVISPEQPAGVQMEVKPVWFRCQKPLIISGGAALMVIMISLIVIGKQKKALKPPLITGTLIHWGKDMPDISTTVDLTALKKTEIRIGKSSTNEVPIADNSLADTHVTILAERVDDEVRMIINAHASIRKGYREYKDQVLLEENITYQMGDRYFKFIRDIDL